MTSEQGAMEAARRIVAAFERPIRDGLDLRPTDTIEVARAYIDANDQIARLVSEIERLRALPASAHRAGMEEAARIARQAANDFMILSRDKTDIWRDGGMAYEMIKAIRAAKEEQDE